MTAIYYLSVYPYEILVEILEPYFFAIARFSEPLITTIQWHLLILLVIAVLLHHLLQTKFQQNGRARRVRDNAKAL
jgi:hypothetical protein